MGRGLGFELKSRRVLMLICIYGLWVFGDYISTQFAYNWHFLMKLGGLLVLLYLIKASDLKSKLSITSTLYLVIGFSVFAISYVRYTSENFLLLTNVGKVIELFFAFIFVKIFHRKYVTNLTYDWRTIAFIVFLGLLFIIFMFDFFSEKLQVVILFRMIQIAILGTYVLFNIRFHWFFWLWILTLVAAEFTAGMRIVNYLSKDSFTLQHTFQFMSYLFFVLGVYLTFQKTDVVNS